MAFELSNLPSSLKIGTVSSGNYTETSTDGTQEAVGDATCWDDIYVYPEALDNGSSNPPIRKQFTNDGSTPTDYALKFIDNTGAQALMYSPLDSLLNSGEFTIEFWGRPETAALEFVLNFGTNCFIRFSAVGSNSRLICSFGLSAFSNNFSNIGAWNHYVCVVDKPNEDVFIYVNNQITNASIGSTAINVGSSIFIGFEGNTAAPFNLQGSMDLLTVYNVMLSPSQVSERYNNGSATEILPTGVTDLNRVLYMPLNDGSGGVIANLKGNSASIAGIENTDFQWVAGAEGISGFFGVYLLAFSHGKQQHAGMSISPSHKWTVGTNLKPHVHFSILEPMSAGETVKFGLEYTLAEFGSSFPNTQILTATYTATGSESIREHLIVSFPEINMSGITKISPQISATFFRYNDDTYAHDVFLLNQGTHFNNNMIGSRQEFIK